MVLCVHALCSSRKATKDDPSGKAESSLTGFMIDPSNPTGVATDDCVPVKSLGVTDWVYKNVDADAVVGGIHDDSEGHPTWFIAVASKDLINEPPIEEHPGLSSGAHAHDDCCHLMATD